MSREALKMALEALEDRTSLMKWQKAIAALREALVQPEQEPKVNLSRIAKFKLDSLQADGFVINGYAIERRNDVATTRGFMTDGGMVCWWFDRDHEPASPPQRQPLTDDEALDLLPTNTSMSRNDALLWVLRSTERAHNIKGTT